jgi:hypothetical protein
VLAVSHPLLYTRELTLINVDFVDMGNLLCMDGIDHMMLSIPFEFIVSLFSASMDI